MTMELQIKNISKSFNRNFLFDGFTVDFKEGIITCILGPSGCGKTTLLNILGKIVSPDSGVLIGFEGKSASYIFQEPRLLPWKTVRGNIEFVLSRKFSQAERKEQVDRLIRLVELDGFADHYPSQLSGGMRQRVSIARAFASPSDVILMDEPLSGLDIALKRNIIQWFSQIWEADKRTVIFVTHDVDEALSLGEEIIVLSQAPVQIVAHESINEPAGKRDVQAPRFAEIRKTLFNALGKTD
ncbi:NitT/TauT family transport system ATP-binding protein [Mariniphaga anaerophila]|uniref:NitT/TauT family transport system ATP-binding protein n=2 Tax=Mariniphaga anaerophila TaxID=1484053 RepID=A0A1M5FDM1_9BACT|nr:NitT/TauT family transport system ATP-binding protein [Mariniphaga anaerophila]